MSETIDSPNTWFQWRPPHTYRWEDYIPYKYHYGNYHGGYVLYCGKEPTGFPTNNSQRPPLDKRCKRCMAIKGKRQKRR